MKPVSFILITVPFVGEQAYLWENNEAVAAWLLAQLSEEGRASSVVANNLDCVKKDAIIQQIKSSLNVCYSLLVQLVRSSLNASPK
jgi:hypothetical protein